MKNLYIYILMTLFLAGCGIMEAMGLYNPATDGPTTEGQALSDAVKGLTGMDVVGIWGAWKLFWTAATKRGRANVANILDRSTGGSMASVKALLIGSDTPDEAKGQK